MNEQEIRMMAGLISDERTLALELAQEAHREIQRLDAVTAQIGKLTGEYGMLAALLPGSRHGDDPDFLTYHAARAQHAALEGIGHHKTAEKLEHLLCEQQRMHFFGRGIGAKLRTLTNTASDTDAATQFAVFFRLAEVPFFALVQMDAEGKYRLACGLFENVDGAVSLRLVGDVKTFRLKQELTDALHARYGCYPLEMAWHWQTTEARFVDDAKDGATVVIAATEVYR